MDIDLMDDAADFQKCQSGDIFGTWCDAMAETIVEVMPRHLRSSHEAAGNSGRYPHNGALRLSVCPCCAGDLVESEGGVELECEDGADGELHAVDHRPEGICQGGCSFWACARKAGHLGPCQPDYEEQDRKAALTSAVVCIAAFVAGGIR